MQASSLPLYLNVWESARSWSLLPLQWGKSDRPDIPMTDRLKAQTFHKVEGQCGW